MFDFVRNHTRLALGFMLLLIIPSFIFFGIDGYTRFTGGGNTTVAKVDGVSITRAEWENVHQRAIDRARRQNPDLDSKSLDSPEARHDTLDSLMRERVLLAAATKMNLAPSDDRLRRLFATDPQFQTIRNPDGSVNRELLAMQGLSADQFAQQLRQQYAVQQVMGGIVATSLAPKAIAAATLDPLLQRREVQFQRFDPAAYRAAVQVSDADLEAFYKAEQAAFKAPEQAEIEYVMLDFETLGKGITVSEDELRKNYTDNAARYTAPEERRASHVLIKVEKDASAADKAKAKARAEELLAQVRKAPATFAEVARKNSQDPGSAAQGGDLDFFGRGSMVKPFETAAFTLKQGEISDVFETDFGFHFLTVTGVKGGQKKAFEEVRGELEAEARKARAKAEWAKVAESFTNTVYEQSDSLQPAIDKLKLQKKTATVLRVPMPGATGPLVSTKFLDAVFGTEAVANKRNTDAIEVAPNQLVSARVLKHLPARVLPLAEVKDQVRAGFIARRAAEQARKDGEARLTAVKAAPAESLPETKTVSRVKPEGLPRLVLEAVLRADAGKLPMVVGVDLKDQGYVVVRVSQVLPREEVPGGDEALRAQFGQAWARAEGDAYLAALKKRFKAEVKADVATLPDAASAPGR
jgi:peptidyl-prolyl cis-trans isomerase D